MDIGPETYRTLIARYPDPILLVQGGRITFVNAAAAALLGAPIDSDIVGAPLERAFAASSRPMVGQLLHAASGDATAWPRSLLNVTNRDGSVRDVEVTVSRLDSTGAFQLTLRDVSETRQMLRELRESEERLRLAFAGAQEGVWDWNLETGAVVYSPRWKTMLGYDDSEIEPHVGAWERLLHPDDRARADAVNRGVREGRPSYEAEFRLRHKDGHYVHVLSRGLPIRGSDGRAIRIVGTHFDLSERKRAEDALRLAHEALEQRVRERTAELAQANQSLTLEMHERERAERARTDLLGRLVFAQEDERRRIAREMHDQFGEHLTALSRAVERLMAHAAADPQLAQTVTALDLVTQRLDRDVEHLVWELRPTALDDLGLRAALSNYAKDWSARTGVSVQMHTAGLMDDRLPRDVETTLYRIAQEALTNIAKHARATQVDVLLERRTDAVVLALEDNGVGFDRETPPDSAASTGESPGAARSFGLLGMQERAALIGATLSIESSIGGGTSVLLRMTGHALSAKAHG